MTDTPDVKRILLVDDEAHIVHVVSMKLRNAGYEVITASDGEEAFDAALVRHPHMVITDLQMPVMSGLDLCAKLKTTPQTAAIPALMLTARGFNLNASDLARTNIRGVLSKPFSPREVLEKVVAVLNDNGNRAA